MIAEIIAPKVGKVYWKMGEDSLNKEFDTLGTKDNTKSKIKEAESVNNDLTGIQKLVSFHKKNEDTKSQNIVDNNKGKEKIEDLKTMHFKKQKIDDRNRISEYTIVDNSEMQETGDIIEVEENTTISDTYVNGEIPNIRNADIDINNLYNRSLHYENLDSVEANNENKVSQKNETELPQISNEIIRDQLTKSDRFSEENKVVGDKNVKAEESLLSENSHISEKK